MKKEKRALSVFLAVTFLGIAGACNGEPKKGTDPTALSREDVVFSLCEFADGADFHSDAQKKYLAGDVSLVSNYANGTKELSIPDGITLSWTTETKRETGELKGYVVSVSESEDFLGCETYATDTQSVCVDNLKVATKYYWKVRAEYDNGTVESAPTVFSTVSTAPRNLKIAYYTEKGNPMYTTNARDIGGWESGEGRVKQGLLFRTSNPRKQMNDAFSALHVKTEIDLRDDSETTASASVLSGVTYYHIPMTTSGNILLNNKESLPTVFELLAEEENYPMIFHCSIGTDRTGMVAYMLNAVLGVSEEDLLRDYLFSNFGLISSSRSESAPNSYKNEIMKANGETFAQKAENLLISYGVSATDIQKIREIFL